MVPTLTARPTYLISLKQFVVAQDIAQTVAEFDPTAQVIVVTDPATATLADEIEQLRIAFLGVGPSRVTQDPLASAVLRRGGRLVLINEEAELAGDAADWWVLARPFTTDAVLNLLHRAQSEGV